MTYLLDGQESSRLLFLKISMSDFPLWLEFHSDPRTSVHWIDNYESPEKECEKWYQKQFARYDHNNGGMNALIEKVTGKLVGHAGLLIQTVDGSQELEIAYSLLPAFWNKGYASEAAKKCRDFAFENNLAPSLISIISSTNLASEKVALKNSMQKQKETVYNSNRVNIFRISMADWAAVKNP